jgi:hypothetical protein
MKQRIQQYTQYGYANMRQGVKQYLLYLFYICEDKLVKKFSSNLGDV